VFRITTAEAFPIANVARASPAMPAPRPSTSETNSGTMAMRSPKNDQPVAKFDNSAAR
jgi:hypothetical protein